MKDNHHPHLKVKKFKLLIKIEGTHNVDITRGFKIILKFLKMFQNHLLMIKIAAFAITKWNIIISFNLLSLLKFIGRIIINSRKRIVYKIRICLKTLKIVVFYN